MVLLLEACLTFVDNSHLQVHIELTHTGDRRICGVPSCLYVLLCLLSQFMSPWTLTTPSVIANPASLGQVLFPSHEKILKSFITKTIHLHWSEFSKTFPNTCSFFFIAVPGIDLLFHFLILLQNLKMLTAFAALFGACGDLLQLLQTYGSCLLRLQQDTS